MLSESKVARLCAWSFVSVVGVVVLVRSLFSLVFLLLASITLYWWLARFTLYEPLSLVELVEFVVTQSDHLLAAVGVVVAIYAISAWKDEKRVEMRLDVRRDLHEFFEAASKASRDLMLVAESLLALHDAIDRGDKSDAQVKARVLLACRDRFSAQKILGELIVSSHGLEARHGMVLSSMPFSYQILRRAVAHLNELNDHMWFLLPEGESEAEVVRFAATCSRAAVEDYLVAEHAHISKMLMWSGALVGGIGGIGAGGALFPPSLSQWLNLIHQVRSMSRPA